MAMAMATSVNPLAQVKMCAISQQRPQQHFRVSLELQHRRRIPQLRVAAAESGTEVEVEAESSSSGSSAPESSSSAAAAAAAAAAASPSTVTKKEKVALAESGKQVLGLRFLWMDKNIGIALDQIVPGHGTIPLSPFYFWPKKDAWEELKAKLESKPWISKRKTIILLNQATDIINLWQQKASSF